MSVESLTELTHSQVCIEKIQHDILQGFFEPGEKLQTEKLKKRYEVGSSPIREALFHLSRTGLIEFTNNRGFNVTKLSEAEVVDIYHTFTQIECLALEQAIDLGDEMWEGQVLAALHCLARVENKKGKCDYSVWVKRNADFHHALIAGCKSVHLLRIRNDLNQRFEWFGYLAFLANPSPLKLNHEEHKKLAGAVLQRNKKLASKLMHEHLGDAGSMMVPILKKRGLV